MSENEDEPVRISDSETIQRALIEAFGDDEEGTE